MCFLGCKIHRMAMYLYLTKIQRFAYASRSPLQGAWFPDGLPSVSVEEVADHAKKLARLLVVERLDGRVVDVVKNKWFHIFLLMFFRGCFTAFRKSLAVRMCVLLSRKQKARRFFCELCAVLFCEGRDGSPSYKSNGDTCFMHTLENFSEKIF